MNIFQKLRDMFFPSTAPEDGPEEGHIGESAPETQEPPPEEDPSA
jgi:hypothetical protein